MSSRQTGCGRRATHPAASTRLRTGAARHPLRLGSGQASQEGIEKIPLLGGVARRAGVGSAGSDTSRSRSRRAETFQPAVGVGRVKRNLRYYAL